MSNSCTMAHDLYWLTERPVAHRGLHDLNQTRWENTLSAFEAAARAGFAIECDVHLSADGVPVVFHDDDTKRLLGAGGRIGDRTAAELVQMKVGGTDDHVPSLAETLVLVAGRVPIVIELKGAAGRDNGLVARVAATLGGYDGHAAIMSFDHGLIRQFATDAPGIPGGLTAQGRGAADLEGHFSMLAHPISFVSFAVADLPNRFVTVVRERLGLAVITWTVREQWQVDATFRHADQMTFEGFDPKW